MPGLTWTDAEPTRFDTCPGKTARAFCPDCGSHDAARDHGDATITGARATALDHHDTDPAYPPT
ncbi:hypothetical protein ACIRU5_18820 [Streptomyces misionensis]|uniref:hypothetical protein n=1 Tax=Streptomyces misionensis TaxID=67331 RepID=UPI00381C152C